MGVATLRLAPGQREVLVARLGFSPDTLVVLVRPGLDTTIAIVLDAQSAELAGVTVSATRSERRVEDEPLRVEVLSREEVEEKLLMTPGDITMMLNETSGLRVQTTSPSLGGANVRVQGLRGRYTQILSDGLPLYGGQTGGLGLLQIPPMDLGGVEVIKGVASALYGGSALGGVINLTSRRPGAEAVREVMLNHTTLGGTDVIAFLASERARESSSAPGYTVLAGGHRQRQVDRDGDGWTDLPGYERAVLRPRAFWTSGQGHNAMLTAGFTGENREGGSLAGHTAPDGLPFPELLRTRRVDAGGVGRFLVSTTSLVSVRASASVQRHRHTFGPIIERDAHRTWFGETSFTTSRGAQTFVVGVAVQQERYAARDVQTVDYRYTIPGVFAQSTLEPVPWAAITASGRVDRHSEYGTFVSPRVSVLLRPGGAPASWNVRTSLGGGYFAPTPFTEETEVIGLSSVRPVRDLGAERAWSGSIDVGGLLGPVEVNGTLFASRIGDPVGLRAVIGSPGLVELVNLREPTRTTGGELLARWRPEPYHITATYTYVRSRETDAESGVRRTVPLTPAHQAGIVTAWESEDAARVGIEVYYTGRQRLDDDAYRTESRPFVHVGVLAERRWGPARIFVNAENLLDYRQTKYDRLVRPVRGLGGRWTNDVWAPLEGRVANFGVRVTGR
jgi:iron complex outermembrane receptor protein